MAVLAKNAAEDQYEFTCAQWALMSAASQADWTVLENTCGIQTLFGNPYAASDFLVTLNGVISVNAPLTISVVDGVYTIGINIKTYRGTISGNSVTVPTTEFIMVDDDALVSATVRRQRYRSPYDFTINTTTNSLDFLPGLNLNGQIVDIDAFGG